MLLRHEIIATEVAARMKPVIEFRTEFLGDGLIDPDSESVHPGGHLFEWLENNGDRRSHLDAHWPFREDFAVRKTVKLDQPAEGRRGSESPTGVVESKIYRRGSVGFDLAIGQRFLNHEFGWTEGSAARWLVVDRARPLIPDVSSAHLGWSKGRDDQGRPWAGWIDLRVPVDLPSSRVQVQIEVLQEQFRRMHGDNMFGGRPTSASSQERLQFAIHRNDGRSWSELIEAWNEAHPDQACPTQGTQAYSFTRSIRRAYVQIMGHPLVWQG